MKRLFLSLLTIILSLNFAYAQTKIAFDDRVRFFNDELLEQFQNEIANAPLEYTTVVDFQNRCDYYFGRLILENEDLVVRITNCNERQIGTKNLGNRIVYMTDQQKAFILANAVIEIIDNPGKYVATNLTEDVIEIEQQDSISLVNAHQTRYFFAPSARNLKKGELYYNAFYFLLHDIQYGVEDNFSIGFGTSVGGQPIYLTPKVSFDLGPKSAVAIGDLMMIGTYGTGFFGNLVYGSYTQGTQAANSTFSFGYLTTNDSDLSGKSGSPVYNYSGMIQAGTHFYVLTENYLFRFNQKQTAYNWTLNYEEYYTQRVNIWYGMIGFRIISKRRDVVSWQIGLNYVGTFPQDIPTKYNGSNWDAYPTRQNMIAFPTVVYTQMFGRK